MADLVIDIALGLVERLPPNDMIAALVGIIFGLLVWRLYRENQRLRADLHEAREGIAYAKDEVSRLAAKVETWSQIVR